eukprot:6054062-Prymnesium_polylepis.1
MTHVTPTPHVSARGDQHQLEPSGPGQVHQRVVGGPPSRAFPRVQADQGAPTPARGGGVGGGRSKEAAEKREGVAGSRNGGVGGSSR